VSDREAECVCNPNAAGSRKTRDCMRSLCGRFSPPEAVCRSLRTIPLLKATLPLDSRLRSTRAVLNVRGCGGGRLPQHTCLRLHLSVADNMAVRQVERGGEFALAKLDDQAMRSFLHRASTGQKCNGNELHM
jgi:hypothetical protein